jgi:hypothetical protein
VKIVQYVKMKIFLKDRDLELSTINGKKYPTTDEIPCMNNGDMWCPLIDVENGIIINWEKGTTANINIEVDYDYRVFECLDENKNILHILEERVPDSLSPEKEGYGEYIHMTINNEGVINKWNPILTLR